jgi:alpha-mannosidase
MDRIAHYVASTHWDREWYEPLQGFRMRLVSMLDEVFETLQRDPAFKTFVMDGQVIPIHDYLEIRPEKRELVERFVREGRLKLGPWYVLPDEWLVSAESIVRNLQMGIEWSNEFGAPSSRAGFVCDQFGHISQLPQIFHQLDIPAAFIWRGTTEKGHKGLSIWQSPDGTGVPTFRFGPVGYCTYAFKVRESHLYDKTSTLEELIDKCTDYAKFEAARVENGPILLFDGGDHLEIEPRTSQILAGANEKLKPHGIRIVHSDLDRYSDDLAKFADKIERKLIGELRETGTDTTAGADEQWLIPGCYSSRIHLKQRNAACEDELCLWAEPFSAFAVESLGHEYPKGFLRESWKWLLMNHPHDSICGCSPDPVHQDMIYRFDQSLGISSRLTTAALKAITIAACPKDRPEGSLILGVFNATAEPIDEPVDLEIALPTNWPKKFQEFFGFEEKFSFKLKDPAGAEIPYQLVGQRRDRNGARRPRYKFPTGDPRHVVSVTAQLKVPAFGYTTLLIEPADGPTRYLGSMATSPRAIENEFLRIEVQSNGTIHLTDKRTAKTFPDLLTFEERADIGDGWYHGVAVNDSIHLSSACAADIALIADGPNKATLRISTVMNVPAEFNFRAMKRSDETKPLKIVSEITLRRGADRIEVTTTVDNTINDHRLRVLLPTGLAGETYLSDSLFDVVERNVSLAPDNATRKELDVETRPQMTWTAFGDKKHGLAVVSRGLPETSILDHPHRTIALTLLRGFRRAVFGNDNPGGQILGKHTFRYDILPFNADAPRKKLSLLGQRVNAPIRTADALPIELEKAPSLASLPREKSFLKVDGDAVVTSIQRDNGKLLARLFNPHDKPATLRIFRDGNSQKMEAVTLDGKADEQIRIKATSASIEAQLRGKGIATLRID